LVAGSVWLTCSFVKPKSNGTPSQKNIHSERNNFHRDYDFPEEVKKGNR
jgi:hypothetical protein